MHTERSPSALSDVRSIAVIAGARETCFSARCRPKNASNVPHLLTRGYVDSMADHRASTTQKPVQWLERAGGSTPARRKATQIVHFWGGYGSLDTNTITVEVVRGTRNSFCSLRIDAKSAPVIDSQAGPLEKRSTQKYHFSLEAILLEARRSGLRALCTEVALPSLHVQRA